MQDAPLDSLESVETKQEIIYVLENEAMPGIVKIGRTCNLAERLGELSNSAAVPYPFRCAYAASVADSVTVERHIHAAFASQRVRKEFFRVPAHSVIAVLELVATEIVTPLDDLQKKLLSAKPDSRTYKPHHTDDNVLSTLRRANRPVSNGELAALLNVTKAQASKRVSSLGNAVVRHRLGRYVAISVAADAPLAEDQ